MTSCLVLRRNTHLDHLSAVREFVRSCASEAGLNNSAVSELVAAADEAVTNIIVHGYGGQPGPLEIEVVSETEAVVVRVRDEAPLFDPTLIQEPDLTRPLEDRPPGGLGIFLMRQYTDHLAHRVTPEGGNELILKKHIAHEGVQP